LRLVAFESVADDEDCRLARHAQLRCAPKECDPCGNFGLSRAQGAREYDVCADERIRSTGFGVTDGCETSSIVANYPTAHALT